MSIRNLRFADDQLLSRALGKFRMGLDFADARSARLGDENAGWFAGDWLYPGAPRNALIPFLSAPKASHLDGSCRWAYTVSGSHLGKLHSGEKNG